MRAIKLLFLLAFSAPGCLLAQHTDWVFVGTVSVRDGGNYTYKLQLTDSNGQIKGYSITDISGPGETKAAVTGTLDAATQQLDVRETHVLHSKINGGSFCFIHSRLKMVQSHGSTELKGRFTGYEADGKTECASGKITMLSQKDVLSMINRQNAKDTIRQKQQKQATVYEQGQEIRERDVRKVKPGDTLRLFCHSPSVAVELWDAKTIDGDIVSLLQDGKTVLRNYTLAGMHKQVQLSMEASAETILTLIAISEGTEPLNTARIKITSGASVYYIDAATTIGKNVVIILKR